MHTYYANFLANNSTSLMRSITGTNKNRLKREIVALAKSECFYGSAAKWSVCDESGYPILSGTIKM